MPDDLRSQVAPIHQMIKAMGFPFLMVEGVEADDVIGTWPVRRPRNSCRCSSAPATRTWRSWSPDHVTLIDTMKDVKTDREGVIEKFGVPPELIIDHLALMGTRWTTFPA